MSSGATDDPFTASSAHDIRMISVGQRERNIEGGREGKMEGDLTEEIKVALSEEERLARAVTKSSRGSQLKFDMSEIMNFVPLHFAPEHVPPKKQHAMVRNNAFLSFVCCSRSGTCSENIWTLNVVDVQYLTICTS